MPWWWWQYSCPKMKAPAKKTVEMMNTSPATITTHAAAV
jgi:hypothetical protein